MARTRSARLVRRRTLGAVALVVAASGLVVPTEALGTTHLVGAGATTAAIQAAIDGAAPGDTVELAAGTYELAGTVVVPTGIRLTGAGADLTTGTRLRRTGSGTALAVTGSGVTLTDLRVDKGTGAASNHGTGIDVGVGGTTVTGLVFERVAVTGAAKGINVGATATVRDWVIRDSEFSGNRIGWYLAKETANASTIDDFTATGVVFRDNEIKGCYFEKLEDALLEDILLERSGTEASYDFNAGCDINLKWSSYADIELRDITAIGSGLPSTNATTSAGAAVTIKARDDAPRYAAVPAFLDGVTITDLDVTGGQVALRLGEPGKANAGPTGVRVVGSRATGTTTGRFIDNQTGAPVTADRNWWGQLSGPQAGQAVGLVTAPTWCTASACTSASDEARLTALSITGVALAPAFDPAVLSYSAHVGNSVNAIVVTASTSPGATATVAGTLLSALGSNPVKVTVTALDGVTRRVYAIDVVREPPPAPPTTTTTVAPTTTTVASFTPPTTLPPIVIARPPSDPPPPPPRPAAPTVVVAVTTPSGNGNIQVTPEGRVIATGDAPALGGLDAVKLQAPVTSVALTPTGAGYWVVAADGGVFTFGDAPFLGSTGAKPLNQPVVGLAPSVTGQGYLTVAADGGVFAFGDAPLHGSMANTKLNAPVTSATMTPTGKGYVLVGADGGIFTFGDAKFYGSAVGAKPRVKATSVTMTSTGRGYWVRYADGSTVAFGDASRS